MTHQYNNIEEDFNKESPSLYETTDFYLASFLKAIGYTLNGLGKIGSRTVFKFTDKQERPNDLLAFYNSEGSVPPLTLISSIREMKALIHNC